ncbi:recombinase family protein [Mycobacteroides immunogenum]|uniref:recombinase family protein n=1 Tax=Mycobacteroides immunogenum TaxID=83262 RepID=UPI0006C88403|nr:recombinase family protein [Mycobacteroides immunogenum]
MKAVIYTRVSYDDAGRSRSTDDQERECRAFCDSQGWPVRRVLCDKDVGASRYSKGKREAFEELKKILQPGDILVMWENSRAERRLGGFAELRDQCAELQVPWAYKGRVFDMNRSSDRLQATFEAVIAENEIEQMVERMVRGKRSAAAEGKPFGHPPWGYKILRDQLSGRAINFVFDPEEIHLVRDAVRSALAGESMRSIAKRVNADGTRPRFRPQSGSSLRRAIINPQLAGLRMYRGEVIGDALWEPIISREEHEKLVALITDPRRKSHNRGYEPRWLLTGIAVCGVCGALVARKTNRGQDIYICRSSSGCVGRNIDYTDEVVKESVLTVLENLDPMIFAEEDGSSGETLTELRRLEDLLDEYVELAATGEISPRAYAKFEQKLIPQIESARSRLTASQRASAALAIAGPDVRRLWAAYEANGAQGLLDRRAVLRFFDITIRPIGRGRKLVPESIDVQWRV